MHVRFHGLVSTNAKNVEPPTSWYTLASCTRRSACTTIQELLEEGERKVIRSSTTYSRVCQGRAYKTTRRPGHAVPHNPRHGHEQAQAKHVPLPPNTLARLNPFFCRRLPSSSHAAKVHDHWRTDG